MIKRIFRSVFFTSLAVLIISLAAVVGSLYYYFENIQETQMKSELLLASEAVEHGGVDYLEEMRAEDLRLTWIDTEGNVLYDTQADASHMENHKEREEIQEALQDGWGRSSRYSATLAEKTIYYANLLEDGSILRISVSQASVFALLGGMAPWLLLAALVAALLSWMLARQLAKRIVVPLNQMDLKHPLENDVYEELFPLLDRIQRQQEQIQEQMAQLTQKTEEFQHITGNMKEGLILLDGRENILSINPAACALFGIGEDSVGMPFLTVDRGRSMQLAIAAALKNGHGTLRQERRGRHYQFDISSIGGEGDVQGLVILAVDVSEQEFAERTRREFTANVSHELKTPLTSILGSAELMENGLVKPEDTPRFIGHIRKEAVRLLTLIEDILRLSQLDEGERLPKETVDLGIVAQEVVSQLQDAADKRKVKLELKQGSCILQGVPRLLHDIVYNLVENAIKYNVEGGTVTIDVFQTVQSIVLEVADTGIGIPQEHQGRVFERFYRVDKSHSRATGGTGLGLSIVKHAAAYCGAEIALKSKEGNGTVITVTFPMGR